MQMAKRWARVMQNLFRRNSELVTVMLDKAALPHGEALDFTGLKMKAGVGTKDYKGLG